MIGAGYVGLVSGTCFAEFGASVTCVDVIDEKISALKRGEIPIYEPGLDQLVEKNVQAGRLAFSTQLAGEVPGADIIFIAVGTPTRRGDGHADLTYVYEAAKAIGVHLQGYTVIVNKSTVPVGTAAQVARIIGEVNPAADFSVASNPEFLREGAAISDFMRPDRVVLGVEDERAEKVLRDLYRPINLIEAPILVTNWESAELTKYAANAFLATKISFINEIANLCEAVGADVHAVAKGMGLDGRIGKKFLHPGPGYGGSCFPKDTKAITATANKFKTNLTVIKSVIKSNENRSSLMLKRVFDILKNKVNNKNICFLGVTFKANTDDMRDSSSLTMIPALIKKGAKINYFDPTGEKSDFKKFNNVTFSNNIKDAIKKSDLIIIHTEWNDFKTINFKKDVKNKKFSIFDMRNIYSTNKMKDQKIKYFSIGN